MACCLAGSQTPRLSSALALGPKPQRHSPHTSHSSSTTTTTATSPSSTLCQHQHNLWRPCNPHCHLHPPPPPPPPPQDPLPNGANVGTGGGTDAVLVDCLPTSTLQAQHGTVSGSARARLRPSAQSRPGLFFLFRPARCGLLQYLRHSAALGIRSQPDYDGRPATAHVPGESKHHVGLCVWLHAQGAAHTTRPAAKRLPSTTPGRHA